MNKSIVGKLKYNSYADIVSGDDTAITEIPLEDLHEFKGHPFRVAEDERLAELVESIRQNGVLTAGTVRPRAEGGYEIISGHRRKRACELAGLESMPAFIKVLDDDEAIIQMVDANLQREEVLPSEKAKAYSMKYEAMKHQGSRDGGRTICELGEKAGESSKTVQRYIWLARLSDELLSLVDLKRINFISGVDISFLDEKEQEWVLKVIKNRKTSPTVEQTAKIKEYSIRKELTPAMVELILSEEKTKARKFTIKADRLDKYFDASVTEEEIEETIYRLLDEWIKNR